MATSANAMRPTEGWLRSQILAARFAWTVVAYNILVILWGALVRATGSGAGCGNHWPLCNGQVIPIAPGVHTVIEFVHRVMTGGASFLVLGLVVWTFRATSRGRAARTAAVLSGLLLLNEAFLGALLVKLGYVTDNRSLGRVLLLAVHLSNTLILLAALTMTALLLRSGYRRDAVRSWATGWRRDRVLAVAGVLATLLVGVTGSLAALGDTLFPSGSLSTAIQADFAAGSPWLIRLRWVHPVSAVIAAGLLLWLLRRSWSRGAWTGRLARGVAGLLLTQFVLGTLDVLLLAPVWLQLVHLLGADLYWVALVSLSTAVVLMDQEEQAAVADGARIAESWRGERGVMLPRV